MEEKKDKDCTVEGNFCLNQDCSGGYSFTQISLSIFKRKAN